MGVNCKMSVRISCPYANKQDLTASIASGGCGVGGNAPGGICWPNMKPPMPKPLMPMRLQKHR